MRTRASRPLDRGPSCVIRSASTRFSNPTNITSEATLRSGSPAMNKAEFVDAVADAAELSKLEAARAVDAMVGASTKALKKGDTVTLVGFGTFAVRERGARTGRNPRTGDAISIAASKNPAFKAGKALKDAVN